MIGKRFESSSHFLAESITAFNQWIKSLDDFPNWLEGNVVAVLEQLESNKNILVSKTAFVTKEQAETLASDSFNYEEYMLSKEVLTVQSADDFERCSHLGMVASCQHILHGNVVGLYCTAQKHFLRLLDDEASFAHEMSIVEMPLEWDCERFLVISLGEGRFAFYCICKRQLLAMVGKQVIGLACAIPLDSMTSDDCFIAAIPSEAIFLVNAERSDQSAVSLFSEKYQNYLTMTDDDVNGDGTKPRVGQTFDIVLVMTHKQSQNESVQNLTTGTAKC
jgi:hypothetical protein